ncbi:hypothetical protein TNCV_3184711 [Trichonephila clavipes]|nr:hypothetical protein TNCV_3184711 [Trichonephila clavipes]
MRWQPTHQTFTRVYQKLAKHGSVRTAIEGTGHHEQHEHLYSKRLRCKMWTIFPVAVYGLLPLQPKDPRRMKPYFRFMYRVQ